VHASPAIADGTVFIGSWDSSFYALDANTGQKKWAFGTEGSWVVSSPAVRDGTAYFITSGSSLLYSLNAASGAVEHSLGLNHWYLYSSPALASNILYVGSTQGKLVAVELTGMKLAWSFETEAMKKMAQPTPSRMERRTATQSIRQISTTAWWRGSIGS
jgi:eukaryotic-like serine/threonine-protein kinase